MPLQRKVAVCTIFSLGALSVVLRLPATTADSTCRSIAAGITRMVISIELLAPSLRMLPYTAAIPIGPAPNNLLRQAQRSDCAWRTQHRRSRYDPDQDPPTTVRTNHSAGVVSIMLFWTMIEVGVAVIAACLPTLRPLFDGRTPESIVHSLRSVWSLRSLRNEHNMPHPTVDPPGRLSDSSARALKDRIVVDDMEMMKREDTSDL